MILKSCLRVLALSGSGHECPACTARRLSVGYSLSCGSGKDSGTDRRTTSIIDDWSTTDWAALARFAQALRQQIGATRVLLFGSRARRNHHKHSDYDLIIISPRFDGIPLLNRGRGLRQIWYGVGGEGPMDLICVTPDELELDRQRASLIAAVLPEAVDLLSREESCSCLPERASVDDIVDPA